MLGLKAENALKYFGINQSLKKKKTYEADKKKVKWT